MGQDRVSFMFFFYCSCRREDDKIGAVAADVLSFPARVVEFYTTTLSICVVRATPRPLAETKVGKSLLL